MKNSLSASWAALAVSLGVFGSCQAQAQKIPVSGDAPPSEPSDFDIVVTARKRAESLMRTPVVVQAITGEQLQTANINNLAALSTIAPGLEITQQFATTGATVYMRGLGNGAAAPFTDQSVLLNVDGASLSHGAFYRGALFDVGQIEVLKGPQALFFGKSASAGIVAIRSADPTAAFDARVSGAYEFRADERKLDAYVSGPLADGISFRIAGFYDATEGYLYNRNPATQDSRLPNGRSLGGRATLKLAKGPIRATARFTHTDDRSNGATTAINQLLCTNAVAQNPLVRPYEDCKLNTTLAGNADPLPFNPTLAYAGLNPTDFRVGTPVDLFRDGRPYAATKTNVGTFNGDVDIAPGLTFTSVTAYSMVNSTDSATTGSIELAGRFKERDWSEETRLASDWKDSWINFLAGGLISRGRIDERLGLVVPNPGLFTDNSLRMKIRNESAFGQVLLTPIQHFELSGGLRYTHITRFFTGAASRNNYPAILNPGPSGQTIQNVPSANRRYSEDNISPEITLTFRPTDEFTSFVSYKQGYKGPGFNGSLVATTYNAAALSPFGGEKAQGFEGGIKTSLLDRQIALVLSAYRYKYSDLQVSFPDLTTNTVNVSNAADARVQGVEIGANFRSRSVPGLTLGAFLNYNRARYLSFPVAPCYNGQTAAAGCVTTAGGARFQDLSGRPLTTAPRWVGHVDAGYRTDISPTLMASVSAGAKFSSGYNAIPEKNPNGVQSSYALLDAAVHLGRSDERWDVALVGRNLTNKIYISAGADGARVTPGVTADGTAYINRPREVLLQLTVHPGF